MRRQSSLVIPLFLAMSLGCEGADPGVEEGRAELGSGLFATARSVAVGSWASATAIADVNGDGKNEVLMTTDFYFDPTNDYKLMVFRPSTTGAMQEIARYPIGQGAESISVGDVNGDGRNDVVVGNSDSDTIGILYQNPSGTLDAMVSIATASALRVRVADLNGDGRKDIVGIAWGTQGDAVELYLQDAQGQLTGRATYHVTHGGYDDLEVGDVNNDGRNDIVVMSGQGLLPNLGVLLQTPQGTFAAASYYSVGSNILTQGVAIGDVTGDGRNDVIVSYGGNRPNARIGIFAQNTAGTLDPVVSKSSYDNPQSLVVADVDSNGYADIVVLHDGWSTLGVYSQSTPGILDAEVRYTIPDASYYSPDGLSVGDFDEDGMPDLAIGNYNYGLVTLKHIDRVPPVVTIGQPNGSIAYVGVPLLITWTASDNVALARFDVLYSPDGGISAIQIPGCTSLGPEVRSCTWASPGPANPSALVGVVARDTQGNTAFAIGAFSLVQP
jgi:hypothetical protein